MGEVSQRVRKAVVSSLGEAWRVMSVVALSAQLFWLAFGALSFGVTRARAQLTSLTPTSVEALTQEALSARLELKRNERLIEAETEAIEAVWGWANPSVGYTLAPAPLETKRGETPQSLTLKQRLPQLNVTTHQRAQLTLRREAREVTQRSLERGVRRGLFNALKNYALDLIPNPLSVFKPWWTWLLVTFGVRFKRATVIELVSVRRDELTALVDDLSREEGGERVDQGARVSELRAQLSRLQLITLQSHHHARPAQWGTLSLITELTRAEGQVLSHPLSHPPDTRTSLPTAPPSQPARRSMPVPPPAAVWACSL